MVAGAALAAASRSTIALPAWRWLAVCINVTVAAISHMDWQGLRLASVFFPECALVLPRLGATDVLVFGGTC
jgi:hypothetical protein